MQDRPAYNYLGYTLDSKLMNPNPNTSPLTLTVILVGSLIRTNQTHHLHKLPLCFQKYITISVGRLLICTVLRIAKSDRACKTVLRITSMLVICRFRSEVWFNKQDFLQILLLPEGKYKLKHQHQHHRVSWSRTVEAKYCTKLLQTSRPCVIFTESSILRSRASSTGPVL